MKPMTRRAKFLGAALVSCLLATGWLSARESGGAEVAEAVVSAARTAPLPKPRALSTSQADADIHLERLRRQEPGQGITDVFAAKSWHVPPPQPKQPEAPAEPTAPPVPFIYLGKMTHEGVVTVFVAKQDQNFAVREGEIFDASYRVDAIKGALMTLTYMPLNMKQTMHIGDAN